MEHPFLAWAVIALVSASIAGNAAHPFRMSR